jgi:hypothetical protein
MYIDGQMGQARWAGLRTARKSTARHGSDRASGWPGTTVGPCLGRHLGTGTARKLNRPDMARRIQPTKSPFSLSYINSTLPTLTLTPHLHSSPPLLGAAAAWEPGTPVTSTARGNRPCLHHARGQAWRPLPAQQGAAPASTARGSRPCPHRRRDRGWCPPLPHRRREKSTSRRRGRRDDGCAAVEQEAAADSASSPPTWGAGMRRGIAAASNPSIGQPIVPGTTLSTVGLSCHRAGPTLKNGCSARPGPAVRHDDPVQPGTKQPSGLVVSGPVGPGQIGLVPGGPFGHL